MRLAELARQNGLQTFTIEDFNFVSSKVTQEPQRLILVGGQALEVLSLVFEVPSPLGDSSPLTEDTDWLGSSHDAKWLCDKLGGPTSVEIYFPSKDDHGASSALAYLKRGSRVLLMDFLHGIVGPTNQQVRELAVPVTLSNDAEILVLHPLLCLESRFANLKVIPEKRSGNGPLQAKWSVQIASAFLSRLAATEPPNQISKACRKIFQFALSDAARYCLVNFGLNPMDAVLEAHVTAAGGGFASKEWPIKVEQVKRQHQRWLEIASRTVQQVPGSGLGVQTALS